MKNLELIFSITASLLAIVSTIISWKNSREITKLKSINSNNSIKGNSSSQVNGNGKIINGK